LGGEFERPAREGMLEPGAIQVDIHAQTKMLRTEHQRIGRVEFRYLV